MNEPRRIAVRTELVLEHLVAGLTSRVEDLYPGRAPDHVSERGPVAVRGYLARVVETESFAAARLPSPELREAVRLAGGAVDLVADALARAEPLEKPTPNQPALTWRVAGPGGHVRHFLALAAIQEAGLDDRRLKREWVYGFAARCCEEAVEADAP